MNANITKRNELLAEKTIAGLKSRNMEGYYAASKEEALKKALELIPEGSSISMGGAMSVHEIGLSDALKEGNYNFIDRDAYEDKREAMLLAYDADFFLASANAMTDDGIIVNVDGNSNRVSAIAQGPKHVLFIVGMNKVCSDLDAAMKRCLLRLQVSRYDLLSDTHYPLLKTPRKDQRHPRKRQPRLLSWIFHSISFPTY